MIHDAVESVRAAQVAWSRTSPRQRAAVARRFATMVLRRQVEILDTIQRETLKNRLSAFEEVVDAAQVAHFYGRRAPRFLAPRRHRGAIPVLTKTVEHHRPVGVVGVITPWNYPFTLPVSDVVPALLAGNGVVLVPDAATPDTADIVAELLREAGLPEGILRVVHGGGRIHGEALLAEVDFVMFTGSTATGKIVAARAAERLIGFSGELGGKNPLLVLDDADVSRAAHGAVRACFSNSGQLCVSVERIYVVERHREQFLAEFVAHTEAMTFGTGTDWQIDMGPLISTTHADRVMAHIDDAISRGATIVAGGRRRPDIAASFVEPTILTNVPADALLGRGETFGPVVAVYSVPDDATAFACANDSEYGLNASVWTRHPDRIIDQLVSGTVTVNEGYSASWASHGATMGGVKQSGVGRRHGRAGILKYTEPQTIAVQRLVGIAPVGRQSYRAYAKLLTRLLALLNRVS